MSVHSAAAQGYATQADRYVRGRPDYPQEVDSWLRARIALAPGSTVIDLGAGTGKFTKRLVATGARVIAIDPVAQMLDKLKAAVPNVEGQQGTADAIPMPDTSVDAVICAQSFHWFSTKSALAEIHRVLKPGGRLGLIWNMRDARVPWVKKLDAIVDVYEGDAPRFYHGAWRAVFPFEGFSPLDETHFSIEHVGTAEDVIVNRVRSTSFIAALPAEKESDVVARVRALVSAEPALADTARVSVPYVTFAFSCIKL